MWRSSLWASTMTGDGTGGILSDEATSALDAATGSWRRKDKTGGPRASNDGLRMRQNYTRKFAQVLAVATRTAACGLQAVKYGFGRRETL